MPSERVTLRRPLPEHLSDELAKRLYFVCDAIDDFNLVTRDGAIEAVEVSLSSLDAHSALLQSIAAKINRMVDAEVRAQRLSPPHVVWRSAPGGPYADPLPALLDAGTAYFAGEGQVGLGEPILSLMDDLDARLRAVAMDTVGTAKAVEYRYPTLLPTSALERFGYFGSFPQYVMFVTRLHSDADVYDAFLSAYADRGRLGPELFAYCRSNEYCLPPTMCYHTYHHYRDRRLPCDTMVTATGKAFRFESRYRSGLERLWDFTIRELVFLGGAEFVADRRDRVMRAAIGLVEELGLTGRCELAHDHFFGTGTVAEKILSQRMMHLKYELILDTAEGRSVAVGSFNLHGQFFGESFGIDGPDGSPVASACVGFGLERLAAAFLCQHGTDPAAWPRLRSGRPG